jgi:hypothetical protein
MLNQIAEVRFCTKMTSYPCNINKIKFNIFLSKKIIYYDWKMAGFCATYGCKCCWPIPEILIDTPEAILYLEVQ